MNKENMHIVPIDDLKEHDDHDDCWCNPIRDEENSNIVIHNSMDGREAFESGERKPS